ncbi:isochorismatase family protein [Clostridium lundense]|uniref:isochorismatase family protein n=1 Tax=Clostridium lundense TaxID=319475 RepID=UPI0004822341|nr:isochorismatase family protein [Clostridium lundense]
MGKSILVVDCQNDFITGSLACTNGEKAVENIIKLINNNKDSVVVYSCDWHKESNKSFKINGGIWPIHCVKNTDGAKLHNKFYNEIENYVQSPLKEKNIFYKGIDDVVEEYSAVNAKNIEGKSIEGKMSNEVIVCGIASEFCVKETIKELLKKGFNVSVYKEGVAYVEENGHREVFEELMRLGVEII